MHRTAVRSACVAVHQTICSDARCRHWLLHRTAVQLPGSPASVCLINIPISIPSASSSYTTRPPASASPLPPAARAPASASASAARVCSSTSSTFTSLARRHRAPSQRNYLCPEPQHQTRHFHPLWWNQQGPIPIHMDRRLAAIPALATAATTTTVADSSTCSGSRSPLDRNASGPHAHAHTDSESDPHLALTASAATRVPPSHPLLPRAMAVAVAVAVAVTVP